MHRLELLAVCRLVPVPPDVSSFVPPRSYARTGGKPGLSWNWIGRAGKVVAISEAGCKAKSRRGTRRPAASGPVCPRRLVAAVLCVLVAVGARANADEAIVATPEVVRDLMIQNVCLDRSEAVAIGASPLDASAACATQRDLRPGEALPYHKHDHPSPSDHAAAPQGYQRHDSIPVETAAFGTVIEHGFDFGAGDGRRFGIFDHGKGDGGDIVILSPGFASIGATEDGGGGFQLFVGACEGRITAPALTRSWLIATYDPTRPAPLRGEAVAQLKDVKTGDRQVCPSRLNSAYTAWHLAPFRYRDAPGQGAPVTVTSLISDHYGGARRDTADHVERFYFTRELGLTRWERWQNAAGNRRFDKATIAAAAVRFAATGRCGRSDTPPGGAVMVLVDCREWTRIVAPEYPAGDPPGFFIAALRDHPRSAAAAELFAAPLDRVIWR